MILDYRLEWNREWFLENCGTEGFRAFLERTKAYDKKPVLTPTGRIKVGNMSFKMPYCDTREEYFEFLDWLHFEAGFQGQWVFVTENSLGISPVVAVTNERDAMMIKLRFDIMEKIVTGSHGRLSRH
jgi:hypothetical protein